ncbi:hypothetical protein DKM44_15000 [Deinococcus irradiatisoli]|uniref:Uncharacterized protein n=1 Tax=Deinococcus irradiatisoli TaxID=2202254 RepID=A0A2Z3JMM0_9DEIO|nr:hypothetical protein [Deinococcus irradiatisoli]AWN24370.1 hypothetical protein DKM44_15000 [Deinococcus irradiatisoli]
MSDWPPHPEAAAVPSLSDLLERYATLRDTILSLENEKNELGELIKAALLRGERAETELYRSSVRVQKRLEYPLERFREVFGDAAALEAASIDRKKAEALARAGDLDPERLREIALVKEIQALVLTPKGS